MVHSRRKSTSIRAENGRVNYRPYWQYDWPQFALNFKPVVFKHFQLDDGDPRLNDRIYKIAIKTGAKDKIRFDTVSGGLKEKTYSAAKYQ